MMEIFIDDERNPADPFTKKFFGSTGSEVWVKTAKEAIGLLEKGNVSSISLDHDLGPASAGTGMDVANWIEENAFHGTLERLVWAVHSKNGVGAKRMIQALTNADKFWDQKENATQYS